MTDTQGKKNITGTENPSSLDEGEQISSENIGLRRKGVYLLPNLFTTGAMFSGFYAILAGMDGNFDAACIAIFIAMIFDVLDGTVARMTNTSSDFGLQYDSLSDMVSFGVAPAVLAFSWILNEIGRIGWAAAFIYASCAALRLARFNSQVDSSSKNYFIGIPSPAAAALIASMVWCSHKVNVTDQLAFLVATTTAMSGLLMVSNLHYRSLKEIDLKGKVPFVVIFSIVMSLIVVTIDPPRILFIFALIYSFSAPVLWIKSKFYKTKA
ncbi:MAG: CDP-diacylglycerol--serine O-phosphatidyltransferase [Porticoccus sp.]|jgi:CDP-diacylglycerol--serine O-phosphatidyltransferase|nr:CDP-diacylglycerol--serine O-phosphatidyltransferase [Porticoccus sp.]|tara:strand:+ start:449 stop:1249 length:801 start_codon:yes stop_codon:yes gene_type:complete